MFVADDDAFPNPHEEATRREIARRLAGLLGVAFAGEFNPQAGPAYLVPNDALLAEEALALGITGEHDLFGGVVPRAFVATKAITHPLIRPGAAA